MALKNHYLADTIKNYPVIVFDFSALKRIYSLEISIRLVVTLTVVPVQPIQVAAITLIWSP